MIGYIKGKVMKISENSITLGDSIGYTVNTESKRYVIDQEVELFTHMVVRENDISLWGFASEQELDLFKSLINISGVGPRTAQGLIFNIGVSNIVNAIANSKPEFLKSTGVGLKTAQKIVLELKGKISLETYPDQEVFEIEADSLSGNVLLALVSLGYKEADVSSLIAKAVKENDSIESEEEIIKIVLRNI